MVVLAYLNLKSPSKSRKKEGNATTAMYHMDSEKQ
jgi:hypothetical protein